MKKKQLKNKLFFNIIVSICMIGLFIGLVFFTLNQSQIDYEKSFLIKSKAQTQLLGENLSTSLFTTDLKLQFIKSRLESHQKITEITSAELNTFIELEVMFLPHVINIVLFSSNKEILYGRKPFNTNFYKSFESHRDAWLEISYEAVYIPKKSSTILISRRIENSNGKFMGVLVAEIDSAFFQIQVNEYLDIDTDAIALVDTEGKVLTNWSKEIKQDFQYVGRDIKLIPSFSNLSLDVLSQGGLLTIDNKNSIISTYQLTRFPFKIVFIYTKNEILKSWIRTNQKEIWIISLFILGAVLLIMTSIIQMIKRFKTEIELMNYQDHLKELVKERTHKLEESNLGLEREIQTRKKAEASVKGSLKEKEMLLHEINHRVKNNLSIISSLLSLQAKNVNDTRLTNALTDSQNRVISMSAIHETLYQSDNFSSIDLNKYLSKLAGSITQTYSINNKVKLQIEAENILISVKQASPLGLIVNELITNSLKYAFPDDKGGEIKIRLQKDEEQIVLIYKDDGIGIPEVFDIQNSDSLGLKLVTALVENQLNGTINKENKNGTIFYIKFKIET